MCFKKMKGCLILLIMIVLAGCSEHAQTQVRQKFDIPIYKILSEENIEESVVRKIPIGTNENEIYQILENINIGKDTTTSYYKANEKGEIVVRFEYDPDELDVTSVKKSYGIMINLDSNRNLESVKVHEWLTGV